MRQAHEYSVIGHNRSTFGRYLGSIAAIVAVAATTLSSFLQNFLTKAGFSEWASHFGVLPITAGIAYAIIYWFFNKYAWKWGSRLFSLPDLDSQWNCMGTTIATDASPERQWDATITISQKWDKIAVYLKTEQSASYSVSVALLPQADGEWLLLYSYRNEPRMGEVELHSHVGYCELRFDKKLQKADGEYFNAKGRTTSGRMKLIRSR